MYTHMGLPEGRPICSRYLLYIYTHPPPSPFQGGMGWVLYNYKIRIRIYFAFQGKIYALYLKYLKKRKKKIINNNLKRKKKVSIPWGPVSQQLVSTNFKLKLTKLVLPQLVFPTPRAGRWQLVLPQLVFPMGSTPLGGGFFLFKINRSQY